MNTRETSIALVSSWLHEEQHIDPSILSKTNAAPEMVVQYDALIDQIVDLALIGAALLRCWAKEIGVEPHDLLSTIAVGQAMDLML